MVAYKHQSFAWCLYKHIYLRDLGAMNVALTAGPEPPFYTGRVRVRPAAKRGLRGGCPPTTYKGGHSEIFSTFPLKGNSMSTEPEKSLFHDALNPKPMGLMFDNLVTFYDRLPDEARERVRKSLASKIMKESGNE